MYVFTPRVGSVLVQGPERHTHRNPTACYLLSYLRRESEFGVVG